MKVISHLLLHLLVVTLCLSSCKEEDTSEKNLYELLSEDSELSEMKAYIDSDADLINYTQGTIDYTFFAPNNAAFEKLRQGLGTDDLSIIPPAIMSYLIKYHFAIGNKTKAELAGSSIASIQGDIIHFNSDGTISSGLHDNRVEIIEEDIQATNGVMHKIEAVLYPNMGDIFCDILLKPILLGASFTILAEVIVKSDEFADEVGVTTINSILSGTDIITVFAPANETFEADGLTVNSFTGQEWYKIIMNHIVTGNVVAPDLVTCAEFSTLMTEDGVNFGSLVFFNNTDIVPATNGLGIYIDSNGDVVCDLSDGGASLETGLNGEVIVTDVFIACNGVLHVIDGLLNP